LVGAVVVGVVVLGVAPLDPASLPPPPQALSNRAIVRAEQDFNMVVSFGWWSVMYIFPHNNFIIDNIGQLNLTKV
jgi:hypothetical protein